jgi:uncharacterized protein involved in type VI secretion and phage assembly
MVTARSRTTDQRYYGVAEALVTDSDDPEHEGRVKVQFPWFDENMESEWCRVRQLYAGNDYGTFFVPEVGDEVLVAFIHGDMRMPIILGGLYNGQDKPPSFHDGTTKDQKMIRTKGQHEILMDDSSGEERIQIKTKGGHICDLNDKEKKITIVDSSGNNSIVIDANANTVTIKSSSGKLIFDGQQGVEITSKASIKIEATATLDLKGATVNIN